MKLTSATYGQIEAALLQGDQLLLSYNPKSKVMEASLRTPSNEQKEVGSHPVLERALQSLDWILQGVVETLLIRGDRTHLDEWLYSGNPIIGEASSDRGGNNRVRLEFTTHDGVVLIAQGANLAEAYHTAANMIELGPYLRKQFGLDKISMPDDYTL